MLDIMMAWVEKKSNSRKPKIIGQEPNTWRVATICTKTRHILSLTMLNLRTILTSHIMFLWKKKSQLTQDNNKHDANYFEKKGGPPYQDLTLKYFYSHIFSLQPTGKRAMHQQILTENHRLSFSINISTYSYSQCHRNLNYYK